MGHGLIAVRSSARRTYLALKCLRWFWNKMCVIMKGTYMSKTSAIRFRLLAQALATGKRILLSASLAFAVSSCVCVCRVAVFLGSVRVCRFCLIRLFFDVTRQPVFCAMFIRCHVETVPRRRNNGRWKAGFIHVKHLNWICHFLFRLEKSMDVNVSMVMVVWLWIKPHTRHTHTLGSTMHACTQHVRIESRADSSHHLESSTLKSSTFRDAKKRS